MKYKKYLRAIKSFFINLNQQYLVDPKLNSVFTASIITANDPNCYISEQYRSIALSICRSVKQEKVITVTSPQPEDGKTTTVANIAYALSYFSNKKVIIIDGDLRRPKMNSMFNLSMSEGVYEILKSKSDYQSHIKKLSDGLDLISAGFLDINDHAYLSDLSYLKLFIDSLREHYDYILIDTPPVLKVVDAAIYGQVSDSLILLIRAQTTPASLVNEAKAILETNSCSPASSILVNYDTPIDFFNYIMNSRYRNYYFNYYKPYAACKIENKNVE